MTTPSDGTPGVLEAISALQKSFDGLKAQVDAQNLSLQYVVKAQEASAAAYKVMAEGITDLNSKFTGLSTRVDGLTDRVDGLTNRVDGLTDRMDGLTDKVDGLTDDIAEVKGGHARSAMLRIPALIADALDSQLIAEVPRGVLLGFAKVAEAYGEPHNDVQSFKNADMVLHVMNPDNQPGYIAVEASFTVNGRDVARAARNASYLQRYTGLPSCPVVAGVDILQDAQHRIDQGNAQLYSIQRRELQPE